MTFFVILSAIYKLLKIIILITSFITANLGYFFSHLVFMNILKSYNTKKYKIL